MQLLRFRSLTTTNGFNFRVTVASAACLLAIAVLWRHASSYLPFMADDAFISLRYSQRLMSGEGLTWTDGERVEGYTNLLWILVRSFVGWFTDLVNASRIVGVCSTIGVFVGVFLFGGTPLKDVLSSFVATICLALAGPIAVWAIGGLEAPLVAVLLSVVVLQVVGVAAGRVFTSRSAWTIAVASGLLALTRPDAMLLVVAIALGLFASLRPRDALRPALWLLVPAGLAFGAQLLFRLTYYGEWIPNTARLKVKWTPSRLEGGLEYLTSSWKVLLPLLSMVVVAAILRKLQGRSVRLLWVFSAPFVAWAAYLVVIGGDIFPARRHITLLLVLLAAALAWVMKEVDLRQRGARIIVFSSMMVGLALSGLWGTSDPRSLDARNERWEWEGEVSGKLFKAAWGHLRPLLAVHSAGCVPYFSELPSLDLLGLNDAWIAKHLPPSYGKSSLSYDLHAVGDADYVMKRKPDLILPCGPLGFDRPCQSIPAAMPLFGHPQFAASYFPVHFRGEVPFTAEGTVFARLTSPVATAPVEGGVMLKAAFLSRAPAALVLEGGSAAAEFPPKSVVKIDRLPQQGTIDSAGLRGLNASWRGSDLEIVNPTDVPIRIGQLVLVTAPGN